MPTSKQPPHVFLIDDDPSVNRAVSNLLESAGYRVTAFTAAEDFLADADPAQGDCLVLDLRLPGIDGLALQRAIFDQAETLAIVFITGHGRVADSVQAMRCGAVDFLLKPFADKALLDAVAEAVVVSQTQRRQQAGQRDAERGIAALTPREREVMEWVVSGLRNRDIAERLGVTVQTIKVHRGKVMEKTGAGSLCELVRLADRLADPPLGALVDQAPGLPRQSAE